MMTKTVLQNTLAVLAAVLAVMAMWIIYQFIGEWLFLFFFAVAIAGLLVGVKPKFDHKKKKT